LGFPEMRLLTKKDTDRLPSASNDPMIHSMRLASFAVMKTLTAGASSLSSTLVWSMVNEVTTGPVTSRSLACADSRGDNARFGASIVMAIAMARNARRDLLTRSPRFATLPQRGRSTVLWSL